MVRTNIIGPKVKELRTLKNLDQVELAALLAVDFDINLTQSDISEIERQVRGVKDYELDALAQALEVSPTLLLRGDKKNAS